MIENSEEEKLHFLYAIKRINRMSVDDDDIAEKIRKTVMPRGMPYDFPTGSCSEYMRPLIQNFLQDPDFVRQATQKQKDHLEKMIEILPHAILLRQWLKFKIPHEDTRLNSLMTRATMDDLQRQINQICKTHFLVAAKDSRQLASSDVLTPEALEAATMELGSTIDTLIETLKPINTPESQELQGILENLNSAINRFDYLLK